jgi:hypothetical protein
MGVYQKQSQMLFGFGFGSFHHTTPNGCTKTKTKTTHVKVLRDFCRAIKPSPWGRLDRNKNDWLH